MAKGHRQEKVGEEVKKIIADMLLRDIKDPRLDRMISISAVDVSPDLNYANVFVTVLSRGESKTDEEIEDEVIQGLESCEGIIRQEIGKKMRLHRAPELTFRMDKSMEYGSHMDEILANLNK